MTEQIFISYSKKDSEFAHKLADDLIAAGFKIWIDKSIGGGELWRKTIEKNIKSAGEMIIVVSPNSMESPWVQHEGSMALAWEKRLFPILIEPVEALPPWLEEYQWIDFVNTSHEVAFNALIAALTPPNPIQDLLDQQVQAYQQMGELIGEAILQVIEENRETLVINAEANELINKSRQRLKRTRQILQGGIGLAIISIIVLFVTIPSTLVAIKTREGAISDRNTAIAQQSSAEAAEIEAQHQLQLAQTTLAAVEAEIQIQQLLKEIDLIRSTRLNQALLLSVEVYRRSNTFETINNLLMILNTGSEYIRYIKENTTPYKIAYDPDGEMFMALTSDGIQFWNAQTGEEFIPESTLINGSTVLERDNRMGFSYNQNFIYIWDMITNQQLGPLPDQQAVNSQLEGNIEIVPSDEYDFIFELRDFQTGKHLGNIGDIRLDRYTSFFYSPDDKFIAAAVGLDEDPPIVMLFTWYLPPSLEDYLEENGEIYSNTRADSQWSFLGDEYYDILGNVSEVVFNPDGEYIAATVSKSTDIVYLLGPGEETKKELWRDNQTSVTSLTMECDGLIGIGRADGVILFDGPTEYRFQHPGQVEGLIFSPDCNRMASVGNGFTILFNLENVENSPYRIRNDYPSDNNQDTFVEWNSSGEVSGTSPDGEMVAESRCIQRVSQLDSQSNCIQSNLTIENMYFGGFTGLVSSLAISPDKRILAAGICTDFDKRDPSPDCYDPEIRLWDISSEQIFSIPLKGHESAVIKLQFSPDSKSLDSFDQEGTIFSWDMDPLSWENLACTVAGRNITQEEWQRYFPGEEYQKTCPQWPTGE